MAVAQSCRAFRGTIRRIHNTNEALMFWNREATFKIMLRSDACTDEKVGIEVCAVLDDDRLRQAFEMECSGYVDEDDVYVFDTFEFDAEVLERDEDVVRPAVDLVNAIFEFTLCQCDRRIIRDDTKLCLLCHLTSKDEDLVSVFCFVCFETGVKKHFTTLTCCNQAVHTRCLQQWHTSNTQKRCPHCRS